MVRACSGPSGAPPVLRLAREGPTARFRHAGGIYWKQSKHVFTGRGCQCFREGFFNVLATGGVVPILSCMKNIELWCVGAA